MKSKQDIHTWRMNQIIDRINEYNDQRNDKRKSGEAAVQSSRFAAWEANQLENRKQFEALVTNAVP